MVTTAQVILPSQAPRWSRTLTTPLIGIVSTTAIGRLGDRHLLLGRCVAMASVLFDCMFWLFGFLPHEHGRLHGRQVAGLAGRNVGNYAPDPAARADRRGRWWARR